MCDRSKQAAFCLTPCIPHHTAPSGTLQALAAAESVAGESCVRVAVVLLLTAHMYRCGWGASSGVVCVERWWRPACCARAAMHGMVQLKGSNAQNGAAGAFVETTV